jgi:hypothetical protein
VRMWECENVRMWECENVRMWECENVRMWECESGGWEDERMEGESEGEWGWVRVKGLYNDLRRIKLLFGFWVKFISKTYYLLTIILFFSFCSFCFYFTT